MTVLTKAQADFLIAGMRSNFAHQIDCDVCSKPLGDDRHEVAHGPLPMCVHEKCRDLMMSYKLDRRRPPPTVGGRRIEMTDQRYMRAGLDFARGKAIEELGELQAALGKSLRWGWDSYNPEIPVSERESNADWVRREISDVRAALDNLETEMIQGFV